ncbi:hypothetical protein [Euzebya sp.]|uniref:hypothetical protein n=1 Tax=Euzebya sp. TaxID=1971409 RepID=UPI003514AB94
MLLTSTGQPSSVPPPPADRDIEIDADGLVRSPRGYRSRTAYDAPMFNNYTWVALLDPVELADGHDGVGADVDDVTSVTHHGRQSLQAVLRPTREYHPRCDCCTLLYGALIDERLAADGMRLRHPDGFVHPAATRVRLDIQTGVCVLIEEIGGSRPGRGHDVRIESVDEEMPDDLFPIHPSRRGVGG